MIRTCSTGHTGSIHVNPWTTYVLLDYVKILVAHPQWYCSIALLKDFILGFSSTRVTQFKYVIKYST